VTAIAAFQCGDGLVMAADTEETYPDNKVYTFKLFPFDRAGKRLCIAGCGIGYLIDYAKDQIAAIFESESNVAEFQKRLHLVMHELYKVDFPLYPVDRYSERQIQLLVGVQFADQSDPPSWPRPTLFECQSNLVTELTNIAQRGRILGAGELLKETMVQFANWGLDTELAKRVLIYVMYEAKRRFTGVGGKTHVFTMKTDGTHSYYRGKHLKEQETVLDGFNSIIQLLLLGLDPSVSDRKATDFVDTVKKWLKDARRYLAKIEKGKIQNVNLITIQNSEIRKLMWRLKRSDAQRSEPGQ
jgi:hypothetical protein